MPCDLGGVLSAELEEGVLHHVGCLRRADQRARESQQWPFIALDRFKHPVVRWLRHTSIIPRTASTITPRSRRQRGKLGLLRKKNARPSQAPVPVREEPQRKIPRRTAVTGGQPSRSGSRDFGVSMRLLGAMPLDSRPTARLLACSPARLLARSPARPQRGWASCAVPRRGIAGRTPLRVAGR